MFPTTEVITSEDIPPYLEQDGIWFTDITEKVRAEVEFHRRLEGTYGAAYIEVSSGNIVLQEAQQGIEQDLVGRIRGDYLPDAWRELFPVHMIIPVTDTGLAFGIYRKLLHFGEGSFDLRVGVMQSDKKYERIDIHTGSEGAYQYNHRQRAFDITRLVAAKLLGFHSGNHVHVASMNTTGTVILANREELPFKFAELESFAPGGIGYAHNGLESRTNVPPNENNNATAHLCASRLPPYVAIPRVDGRMKLGNNPDDEKHVYFIEFDGQRVKRQLLVGTFQSEIMRT